MAITRRERLTYFCGLPAGHGSVDWISAGLFLLAPAIAFGGTTLSPSKIGLLFALRAIVASITYIPSGLIGDSLRRQGQTMLVTIWWVGLTTLAAAFSPNYWVLTLLLSISGAGAAFWHPLAMSTMVLHMPERRGMAMAVHGVGGLMAEVLAPLLIGFLLAVMDWRETLALNALIPIGAGILLIGLVSVNRTSVASRVTKADLLELMRAVRQVPAMGVLAATALYNMCFFALLTMTPVYLKDVRDFSSKEAGIAFAGLMLAGALASPLIGSMSDRLGRKPVLLTGLMISGASLWLMTIVPGSVSLVVTMVIAGFWLFSIQPVLWAAGLDVFGQREATVIGFLSVIAEGIGSLGSLLAGLIGEVSLEWAIVFSALLAFSTAVVTSVLHIRNPRKSAEPSGV